MNNYYDLLDPKKFTEPLQLNGDNCKYWLNDLKMMLRIRGTEERLADLALSGKIKTPIHLAIGQEAIPVGLSRHLKNTDVVFGGHRSHAQFLSKGGSLTGLVAEVLCRQTGVAGGRGGSMHLVDNECGFAGSVPLVGATIPLALGAAFECQYNQTQNVAVSYFGDGACEEGVLHETLNLASVMKLPLICVVENNLYSSHLDIQYRQPSAFVSRFADAHAVKNFVVDGNNVEEVGEVAKLAINNARKGDGPAFIEAITYRWRGHVGPDVNIDVGVRRSEQEINQWMQRDPIHRLAMAMISANILSEGSLQEIHSDEMKLVENAIQMGLSSNFPSSETIQNNLYF